MTLTSPSFEEGSAIPSQHTCDGPNRSPALAWTDAPAGTASFALIVDDPDAPAGTWVHWVYYNIPSVLPGLPEGLDRADGNPHRERHQDRSPADSGVGSHGPDHDAAAPDHDEQGDEAPDGPPRSNACIRHRSAP